MLRVAVKRLCERDSKKFYEDFQIKQLTSALFHAESNGAEKRFIETFKKIKKVIK